MAPDLREPLAFSNWVWLLGAVMIVLALLWVIGLAVAYRIKPVKASRSIRTLGQLQRRRYLRQVEEIEVSFQRGDLTGREAHFALAALIRSAGTEKSGINVESMTAAEVRRYLPGWSVLSEALAWCEDETFPPEAAAQQISRGVEFAREVVVG